MTCQTTCWIGRLSEASGSWWPLRWVALKQQHSQKDTRNVAQRDMWAALHELEEQTRDAVYQQLGEAATRFTTAEQVAGAVGTTNGAAVAALPHRLQMRSLVLATKLFIPHFRKLDQHFAHTPRAPFFRYVLAHETRDRRAGQTSAHPPRRSAPTSRSAARQSSAVNEC